MAGARTVEYRESGKMLNALDPS